MLFQLLQLLKVVVLAGRGQAYGKSNSPALAE